MKAQQRTTVPSIGSGQHTASKVHSLLHNDLGVQLPLHISLSRSLILQTEQKDAFSLRLIKAAASCGVRVFDVVPQELKWHPNEDGTRWFLVIQVTSAGGELLRLLQTCNSVAVAHDQPILYEHDKANTNSTQQGQDEAHAAVLEKFHISIAWSLQAPGTDDDGSIDRTIELSRDVSEMSISFDSLKLRVGQDVTPIPLATRRPKSGS